MGNHLNIVAMLVLGIMAGIMTGASPMAHAVTIDGALADVGAADADAIDAGELGPAVGAAIPHQLITADNPDGFDALKGENGMVLFFVRSLDWCPFCKRQATDVSSRIDEFAARGLSVVFVSYDTPDEQNAFAEKTDFQGRLVSDPGIDVINAFGLRNEEHAEGSRVYGIPHPAVFVVDKDGVVLAKFYEDDFTTNSKSYRNRPAVDLILDGADDALRPVK